MKNSNIVNVLESYSSISSKKNFLTERSIEPILTLAQENDTYISKDTVHFCELLKSFESITDYIYEDVIYEIKAFLYKIPLDPPIPEDYVEMIVKSSFLKFILNCLNSFTAEECIELLQYIIRFRISSKILDIFLNDEFCLFYYNFSAFLFREKSQYFISFLNFLIDFLGSCTLRKRLEHMKPFDLFTKSIERKDDFLFFKKILELINVLLGSNLVIDISGLEKSILILKNHFISPLTLDITNNKILKDIFITILRKFVNREEFIMIIIEMDVLGFLVSNYQILFNELKSLRIDLMHILIWIAKNYVLNNIDFEIQNYNMYPILMCNDFDIFIISLEFFSWILNLSCKKDFLKLLNSFDINIKMKELILSNSMYKNKENMYIFIFNAIDVSQSFFEKDLWINNDILESIIDYVMSIDDSSLLHYIKEVMMRVEQVDAMNKYQNYYKHLYDIIDRSM